MMIRELRRRLNRFFIPSLALALTLYFIYSLFYGSRGLLALKELETQVITQREVLNTLRENHDQLAHKVRLLRPESLCPDLLEERAKVVLGFTGADEKVLLENPAESVSVKSGKFKQKHTNLPTNDSGSGLVMQEGSAEAYDEIND